MHNLIKSLNYQTRRDNFFYCFLIVLLGAYALINVLSFEDTDFSEFNGCFFTAGSTDLVYLFTSIICMIMGARIIGWDFNDKTINYELLAGHNKKDVFFSRFIVSFCWCMTMCAVVVFVPLLVVSLIFGWGPNMELKWVLIRNILVFFPLFRLLCVVFFLTIILRNCFLSMIASYLVYMLSTTVSLFIEDMKSTVIDVSLIFSSSNITKLLSYSNYSIGYADGEDIVVFSTALEPGYIIGTICISLAVAIICITASYIFFQKRDMV